MRIIKVILSNKEILEKVYEYFISQCEFFFHVKNDDLTFHFIPDFQNCEILISVCRDASLELCEKFFDSEDIDYTGMTYHNVYFKRELNKYCICDCVDMLSENEARYFKLHANDIIKITIYILTKLLNTGYKNVKAIKCNSGYTFYFAKKFQFLSDLNIKGLTEVSDCTAQVKDLFV